MKTQPKFVNLYKTETWMYDVGGWQSTDLLTIKIFFWQLRASIWHWTVHVIDIWIALYYLNKQQCSSEPEWKVCNAVKQGRPGARHMAVSLRQVPWGLGEGALVLPLRLVIRQQPLGTAASLEKDTDALLTLHYFSMLLMSQISKRECSL